MGKLIYIVPWAICDTDNIYVKKVNQVTDEVPGEQTIVDDWSVKSVLKSPDKRTKDIYVVLDVYRGYDFKLKSRDVSILDVTNSVKRLQELGYVPAEEAEKAFIRQKILKWDSAQVRKAAKKTGTKDTEGKKTENKKTESKKAAVGR